MKVWRTPSLARRRVASADIRQVARRLADWSWRLAFHLTGGEVADCKAYNALIDLPERAPGALLADRGYGC